MGNIRSSQSNGTPTSNPSFPNLETMKKKQCLLWLYHLASRLLERKRCLIHVETVTKTYLRRFSKLSSEENDEESSSNQTSTTSIFNQSSPIVYTPWCINNCSTVATSTVPFPAPCVLLCFAFVDSYIKRRRKWRKRIAKLHQHILYSSKDYAIPSKMIRDALATSL